MDTIVTLSKHLSTVVEIDRMLRKALVKNSASTNAKPESPETASYLDHLISLSKAGSAKELAALGISAAAAELLRRRNEVFEEFVADGGREQNVQELDVLERDIEVQKEANEGILAKAGNLMSRPGEIASALLMPGVDALASVIQRVPRVGPLAPRATAADEQRTQSIWQRLCTANKLTSVQQRPVQCYLWGVAITLSHADVRLLSSGLGVSSAPLKAALAKLPIAAPVASVIALILMLLPALYASVDKGYGVRFLVPWFSILPPAPGLILPVAVEEGEEAQDMLAPLADEEAGDLAADARYVDSVAPATAIRATALASAASGGGGGSGGGGDGNGGTDGGGDGAAAKRAKIEGGGDGGDALSGAAAAAVAVSVPEPTLGKAPPCLALYLAGLNAHSTPACVAQLHASVVVNFPEEPHLNWGTKDTARYVFNRMWADNPSLRVEWDVRSIERVDEQTVVTVNSTFVTDAGAAARMINYFVVGNKIVCIAHRGRMGENGVQ